MTAIANAAGLLWAIGLLWGAASYVSLPVFTVMPTIMTAFFAPGLVLMAMVVWQGARGAQAAQGVVLETGLQLVLALAIWPAAAVLLGAEGPGVIVSLGLGFALAQLVFWVGGSLSPALRTFGFAATVCPTVLVALWALWRVVAGMMAAG